MGTGRIDKSDNTSPSFNVQSPKTRSPKKSEKKVGAIVKEFFAKMRDALLGKIQTAMNKVDPFTVKGEGGMNDMLAIDKKASRISDLPPKARESSKKSSLFSLMKLFGGKKSGSVEKTRSDEELKRTNDGKRLLEKIKNGQMKLGDEMLVTQFFNTADRIDQHQLVLSMPKEFQDYIKTLPNERSYNTAWLKNKNGTYLMDGLRSISEQKKEVVREWKENIQKNTQIMDFNKNVAVSYLESIEKQMEGKEVQVPEMLKTDVKNAFKAIMKEKDPSSDSEKGAEEFLKKLTNDDYRDLLKRLKVSPSKDFLKAHQQLLKDFVNEKL